MINPGSSLAYDALGDGLSEKARGKRRELSTGELSIAAAGAGAAASFILYVVLHLPILLLGMLVRLQPTHPDRRAIYADHR
jgi:hypothetical protein